jgi:uncharacterized protein YecE (DUF72 family)
MAEIRIGTSGWHYKHWVGRYYPAKHPASKMLAWYRQDFDTVEMNNTFYRLPAESALENWRASTQPNFKFAVKGSRFLTHMKKLKDPEPGLEKFLTRVELLGEKLGPILFQLPPNWDVDIGRFEAFLDALPTSHRYAFEFRNETWNTPHVFQLLRDRNIAHCIFHLAGYQSPLDITADIAYIRLHGPGGKYQGVYGDQGLSEWARRIEHWTIDLKNIYVYFDNDDSGYAARDALRLRELLRQPKPPAV